MMGLLIRIDPEWDTLQVLRSGAFCQATTLDPSMHGPSKNARFGSSSQVRAGVEDPVPEQ